MIRPPRSELYRRLIAMRQRKRDVHATLRALASTSHLRAGLRREGRELAGAIRALTLDIATQRK